jgi:hypothetical protein
MIAKDDRLRGITSRGAGWLLAAALLACSGAETEQATAASSGAGAAGGTSGTGGAQNCEPRPAIVPESNFFRDISVASGIRIDNFDPSNPNIPINDHSRLAFADINGDGFDDVVMHSLLLNPQAGIPFEHLVFINNGDGTFSHFSDESGLRGIQAAFFAFGDIDNDGDQDVFAGLDMASLGAHGHQILLNDGQGHFTPRPGSGVEAVPGGVANALFADFNQDAKLDLFMGVGGTSLAGQDRLFFGNGDGSFVDASDKLSNPPAQPSNGSVACDYDNDGDLDIFVSTYGVSIANGVNALWQNDGGQFTNVAFEKGFASQAGGNTFLASTGYGATPEPDKDVYSYMGSNGFGIDCDDVNNDGFMDILLTTISHPSDAVYSRKWSDPTQVLINQGPSAGFTFVNEATSRQFPFNEGDVDGATVDFDNDGRIDVSVSRDKKYEKSYTEIDQLAWFGLMWQRADGSFASMGPASGINRIDAVIGASLTTCQSDIDCTEAGEGCLPSDSMTPRCRRACTSDADCPSEDELCHAKGFCKLYRTMKNAQNHAWSDIDHDGDLDLLVGGRDTGGGRPNFLFQNDIGQQNRWLAVRVTGDGVTVDRDAIGTRVSLVYPGESLVREKKSSRGMYNSEDTRVLHFGLGDRGCDFQMVVRWPDGQQVEFPATAVGENHYLQISYPNTLVIE